MTLKAWSTQKGTDKSGLINIKTSVLQKRVLLE